MSSKKGVRGELDESRTKSEHASQDCGGDNSPRDGSLRVSRFLTNVCCAVKGTYIRTITAASSETNGNRKAYRQKPMGQGSLGGMRSHLANHRLGAKITVVSAVGTTHHENSQFWKLPNTNDASFLNSAGVAMGMPMRKIRMRLSKRVLVVRIQWYDESNCKSVRSIEQNGSPMQSREKLCCHAA